jgi:predicted dehydrogenase
MGASGVACSAEPVRVGILGVGRHASQVLLPALTLTHCLELAAVCTAHQNTAVAAGRRWRVPAYAGYEALLAEAAALKLEAVLVVGAPHGPAMSAALEAGLHVWCETPAVDSGETAVRVAELASRAQRVVEVGSCLRFAPIYRKLRKELGCWRRDCPGARLFQCRYYPYVGHFYNLLLWLNGPIAEVCAVRGAGETLVHLRFANGDLGSVTARRFHNDSVPFEQVAVSAESGLLIAENGQELRRHRSGEQRPAGRLEFDLGEVEAWLPTFSMPYGRLSHLYLRGYVPELEYFSRRVRHGEPSVSGLEDMLATLRVREAIERSAQQRAWEPVVHDPPLPGV